MFQVWFPICFALTLIPNNLVDFLLPVRVCFHPQPHQCPTPIAALLNTMVLGHTSCLKKIHHWLHYPKKYLVSCLLALLISTCCTGIDWISDSSSWWITMACSQQARNVFPLSFLSFHIVTFKQGATGRLSPWKQEIHSA